MPKPLPEIELALDGEVWNLEFEYSPGTPGRNYMPNGDPGYPAEPAEWTIQRAFYRHPDTDSLVELTSLWISLELEDRFADELSEAIAAAMSEPDYDEDFAEEDRDE